MTTVEQGSTGLFGTGDRKSRMPVVFLPHGGGPWPVCRDGTRPQGEVGSAGDITRSIACAAEGDAAARDLAHWEEAQPTVMSRAKPPLFDYYGFRPFPMS